MLIHKIKLKNNVFIRCDLSCKYLWLFANSHRIIRYFNNLKESLGLGFKKICYIWNQFRNMLQLIFDQDNKRILSDEEIAIAQQADIIGE